MERIGLYLSAFSESFSLFLLPRSVSHSPRIHRLGNPFNRIDSAAFEQLSWGSPGALGPFILLDPSSPHSPRRQRGGTAAQWPGNPMRIATRTPPPQMVQIPDTHLLQCLPSGRSVNSVISFFYASSSSIGLDLDRLRS
ncbi:hypothetical protein IF1G_03611 [Cordyceps javanica]|uniref:Uncharacterized protein n=1 Tax=Cordyceps javanica TaxID=43265 RepID=A0A545V830_9HYPO|nr:hypothetical protein IF1G_03611 [Cordyceps javanica]